MSASDHLSPAQFYHGTDFDYTPGQLLSHTEARKHAHEDTLNSSGGSYVYATSDRDHARDFGQHVYEIEPVGRWSSDPEDDTYYRGKRARVLGKVTP